MYCAEWLTNLMEAGLIPMGDMDTRKIEELVGDDDGQGTAALLETYTQCHFFAGISGWSYALQLADWGEDEQVWTGSCPCQDFSVAGKRAGFSGKRDLWPYWSRLIRRCKPAVVFGEQVAAAARPVRGATPGTPDWLSRVRSDMGELDYALGCLPVEAACAGAAQLRDRIWFVAERPGEGRIPGAQAGVRGEVQGAGARDVKPERLGGELRAVPDPDIELPEDRDLQRGRIVGGTGGAAEDSARVMAGQRLPRLEERESFPRDPLSECPPAERSSTGRLVHDPRDRWGEGWTEPEFRSRGYTAAIASIPDGVEWAGTQFIECPDGKWRRLPPPRVRWLGNGIPSRVARLRAFGNAIYPGAAAAFIRAYLEARGTGMGPGSTQADAGITAYADPGSQK